MNSSVVSDLSARNPVTRKRYILIVEDDRQFLDMMSGELAKKGYHVLSAAGEQDLRRHLNDPQFEVVILDLVLDGGADKGLDLVRDIRTRFAVPIILVSADAQPPDRLRAIQAGVDVHITKPFLMKELLIWLERIYKVKESAVQSVLTFSRFQLDPVRRTLQTTEGVALDLTETEFNILGILIHAAGRIVTRDELWRRLRGQAWSPLDRALDGHVARLRAKLEPGVNRPEIIKSARGLGYVLATPVYSVRREQTAFTRSEVCAHRMSAAG